MYQPGQIVFYGSVGLCRVAGLTEQEVGGVRAAYYQLEPRRGGKVLVPTGSETLTKRIRPALSAAEADALLRALPEDSMDWEEDEQLRRANHRAILAAGDARALARLACALYRRQQSLKAAGRRLRQSDEAVWRDAEQLVSDEFAYALGEELAEVVRRLRACG